MENKLTLKLRQEIIEKAKIYAREQNISLSKLIESYLDSITRDKAEASEITPLVKSLSGVISPDQEPDDKAGYADYLYDKYK